MLQFDLITDLLTNPEERNAISKRKLLTPSIDLYQIYNSDGIHWMDPGFWYKRGKWVYPIENTDAVVLSLATLDWDHIAIDLEELGRCPTYPEMCKIKELFWADSNQLALQIHPSQSDYVDIKHFRLHLWRNANVSERAEKALKKKISDAYARYKGLHTGNKKTILSEDSSGKFVVIFGGDSWPTWEEVCEIKQRYWQPEEVAIQFNISQKIDLNDQYMIILWDGADFTCPSSDEV